MFELKTPSTDHGTWDTNGEYKTVDEAIEAAIRTDLDLAVAVIEKDGVLHPVNDWITFRIAGGPLKAG